MAGREIPINPENFEKVLEESKKNRKVDVKREKKGKGKGNGKQKGIISNDAAFELAKQRAESEKIERNRQKQEAKAVKVEVETADISEPKKAADNITSVKETVEIKVEDKTGDDIQEAEIKTLEKDKADWKKHLATLDERIKESLECKENDSEKEKKIREKIELNRQATNKKISEIDAKIKELSKKSDIDVGTKETAETRKPKKGDTPIVRDSADWDRLVGQREWEKLIAKNKAEKPTKEDLIITPDIKSTKSDQIVEIPDDLYAYSELDKPEDAGIDYSAVNEVVKEKPEVMDKKSNKSNLQKPMAIQQHFDDSGEYANNLEAKQEMDELAKQPSPKKRQEFLKENEEATRERDEIALEKIRVENKELYNLQKDTLDLFQKERGKNIELKEKLAAMEVKDSEKEKILVTSIAEAKEKMGIDNIKTGDEIKNETIAEKVKNNLEKVKNTFKKHPKATLMLVGGLYAVAMAGSAGSVAAAPVYFGIKSLLLKAGLEGVFLPYMGGGSAVIGGYAAGAVSKWIMEKIGAVKSDKDVANAAKELIEKFENPKIEAPAVSETPAKTLTELPSEESISVESAEDASKNQKNDAISIETARKYYEYNKDKNNDELNPEDIKKMMEAIKPGTTKNLIKFLFSKEKRRNNDISDWLYKKKKEIEKSQKEKNAESEKISAEEVKTFVGQLKEGKKTGKEIFEYLENLRHHFLYSSKVNFNSKIKPELDKLSRKEKTDMIDSTVEYFMSQEQHKGEFLRRPFIFDLDDIIYGKDFTEHDYVIRGKPKNVEWLQGNKS